MVDHTDAAAAVRLALESHPRELHLFDWLMQNAVFEYDEEDDDVYDDDGMEKAAAKRLVESLSDEEVREYFDGYDEDELEFMFEDDDPTPEDFREVLETDLWLGDQWPRAEHLKRIQQGVE